MEEAELGCEESKEEENYLRLKNQKELGVSKISLKTEDVSLRQGENRNKNKGCLQNYMMRV